MNDDVVILIPAYNPTIDLIELIRSLKENLYSHIVVVDDGSCMSSKNIFDNISSYCVIIHHEKNCGKGVALKTGFQYILQNYHNVSTIITVDADGQHLVSDINKVKDIAVISPNNLILGCRNFNKAKVPFRNKFGNTFMSLIFNLIYKLNIPDTQTGLRAIPIQFINELLSVKGSRYEYEQNMLIYFAQNFKSSISCVNITAVYNKIQVSHFKVFQDSSYIVKCLFQKND